MPETTLNADLKLWRFSIQTEREATRDESLEEIKIAHPYVLAMDEKGAKEQARAALQPLSEEYSADEHSDEFEAISIRWETLTVKLVPPQVFAIHPNSLYGKLEAVGSFVFRSIPFTQPQ